jgi:hypothetical protein
VRSRKGNNIPVVYIELKMISGSYLSLTYTVCDCYTYKNIYNIKGTA